MAKIAKLERSLFRFSFGSLVVTAQKPDRHNSQSHHLRTDKPATTNQSKDPKPQKAQEEAVPTMAY